VRAFLADPPGSSLFNKVCPCRVVSPWSDRRAVCVRVVAASPDVVVVQVRHGVCFAPQQRERGIRRHRYDTIAEGIGLDRLTANFHRALVDDAVRVSDQEALCMAHFLLRHEGETSPHPITDAWVCVLTRVRRWSGRQGCSSAARPP
jgi:hypothetical protein